MVHDWKSCVRCLVVPRVQIPHSPPALDGVVAVPCNLQSAIVGLNSQIETY